MGFSQWRRQSCCRVTIITRRLHLISFTTTYVHRSCQPNRTITGPSTLAVIEPPWTPLRSPRANGLTVVLVPCGLVTGATEML